MADTISVVKGDIQTYNMHIYPGETPTGLWASLMAQNLGHIRGNYTCHMECSDTAIIRTAGDPFGGWAMLNSFDLPWPMLGSHARLSYYFNLYEGHTGVFRHGVYIWVGEGLLWQSAYYYTEDMNVGDTERIAFEWTMEEAGLDAHLDDEKVRVNVWAEMYGGGYSWISRTNEYHFCVAERPF